jgi:DNA polymerase-3 subunit delta
MKYDKVIKEIKKIKNLKVIMVNNDNEYMTDAFIHELPLNLYNFKDNFIINTEFNLAEEDLNTICNYIQVRSLTNSPKVAVINYSNKDLNRKYKITKPKSKTISYEEKLIEVFSNSNSDMIVFLRPDKIDKKKALYKFVEKNGRVVEFKPLDSKQLQIFIKTYVSENDGNISDNDVVFLSKRIYSDLYMMKNALDVLLLNNKNITKPDIKELVNRSAEVVVFDIIDCIADKNIKKSLKLLDECMEGGGNEFQIMTLLIRHFRYLYFARIYKSKFGEKMKLPRFIASKYIEQSHKFSVSGLERILKSLLDFNRMLTLESNKRMVMEYIVMKLCLEGK